MSRRNLNFIKAILLLLVTAPLGTIVVLLIASLAASGAGFAELGFAFALALIGFGLSWAIMGLELGESEELNRSAPIIFAPGVEANRKMGWTLLIWAVAIVAGFGWLVLSMYGTAKMLLIGWGVIGLFGFLFTLLAWSSGTRND